VSKDLTTYQSLVKDHLTTMLSKKPLVSKTVMFQACEKELVIDTAMACGYTPVFGILLGDYQTVNFIEDQPPC